jgi:hypothetical protein
MAALYHNGRQLQAHGRPDCGSVWQPSLTEFILSGIAERFDMTDLPMNCHSFLDHQARIKINHYRAPVMLSLNPFLRPAFDSTTAGGALSLAEFQELWSKED